MDINCQNFFRLKITGLIKDLYYILYSIAIVLDQSFWYDPFRFAIAFLIFCMLHRSLN